VEVFGGVLTGGVSQPTCLQETQSRSRTCLRAQNGRVLQLTIPGLGPLLKPGIVGARVLRFLVWAISAALGPKGLLVAKNLCLRQQFPCIHFTCKVSAHFVRRTPKKCLKLMAASQVNASAKLLKY
jgi:hypothetical protein